MDPSGAAFIVIIREACPFLKKPQERTVAWTLARGTHVGYFRVTIAGAIYDKSSSYSHHRPSAHKSEGRLQHQLSVQATRSVFTQLEGNPYPLRHRLTGYPART